MKKKKKENSGIRASKAHTTNLYTISSSKT